jgi:hypothetical protein
MRRRAALQNGTVEHLSDSINEKRWGNEEQTVFRREKGVTEREEEREREREEEH